MWNSTNLALCSSSCDQCRSVCSTAIADVGYFSAIWPAASRSLVSSDAKLSASDDMTGSWPITSSVSAASGAPLMTSMAMPAVAS